MGQDSGQADVLIRIIQYIKSMVMSPESAYRETLTALAMVYREDRRNPVNQAIRSVIACEKEVYGRTEEQFLEAIRIVFEPRVPIVYPDQFCPVIIFHPDGHVLWSRTEVASSSPSSVSASDLPQDDS